MPLSSKKKYLAVIVDNDNHFNQIHCQLERSSQAIIVINVVNTSFQILGIPTPVEASNLIMLCHDIITYVLTFKSETELNENEIEVELKQSSASNLVHKTCDYLTVNIEKPLTLKQICVDMHTNKNSLSKAFKQELGVGVAGWLRQQRMRKAKYLIESSTMSIQGIALAVGYPDQANFSTTFRAFYGHSPQHLRKDAE